MRALRSRQTIQVPAGQRIYTIGDVHGELALLAELLRTIFDDSRSRDAANTTIVFLGDVIDRGPAGAELLRGLAAETRSRLVILRGNHEAALVSAYQGDARALSFWLAHGGDTTLAGFGILPAVIALGDPGEVIAAMRQRIDPGLIAWIEHLPTSWSAGDYFFAHAGIRPGVALADQQADDLLWIRDDFLTCRRRHDRIVVHGHTIEPGKVRLRHNRIGLDTGAHEHGVLSALALQDDDRWIIQSRRALPPPGATQGRGPADFAEIAMLLAAILDDRGAGSYDDEGRDGFDSVVTPGGRTVSSPWLTDVAGMVPGIAALTVAGMAALLAMTYATIRPATSTIPATPAPSIAAIGPPAAMLERGPVTSQAIAATPPPASPHFAVSSARLRAPSPVRRATAILRAQGAMPPVEARVAIGDPYAGRVARHLTGSAQEAAVEADRLATKALNARQLRGQPSEPAVSLGGGSGASKVSSNS